MKPVPSIVKAEKEFRYAHDTLIRVKRSAQKRCKHKHGTATYHSNTGNYDPSADSYWVDLFCPRCLFNTSMPQEEYRRQVRDGKMTRWSTE